MQNQIIIERLDSYWRNIDKKIFFCFIALFLLGLFFSLSSTSSLAGERLNKDYYFFFSKHLLFMTLAISLMIFISFFSQSSINKIIIPAFIFFYMLLILVPIIGIEVKGAKRWLDAYFFRIQPIELIKPFYVLITAHVLSKEREMKRSLYLFSFLILASIIIFLVNQPDVGQSILLTTTWISLVFIAGISIFSIFLLITVFFLTFSSLIFFLPNKFGYIIERILAYMDPSRNSSFQSEKALNAIKQGGLKGQGMGEGILKESVPEAHTDYIIAVISEEFGSLISISIILIFLYISFRIINYTIDESDKRIKISLCGLSSLLIFQTFIHIGVNTSILPTTGMTLPFLSYGGSSLIGSSLLAGVILSYTKKKFYEN